MMLSYNSGAMLCAVPTTTASLFDIARTRKLRKPLQPLNFVNFQRQEWHFSGIPYSDHRHAARPVIASAAKQSRRCPA
ncbi:MAG: hypothetical protein DI623_09525 [Sphingomonas sanxanigenens]|uniref:Uncharacterized protein n=1 Tax=Sphingomonas sanxanigenens TaxID=397260 RepID=A0A2W5A4V5_9SPHN|nr:MAG: hypothetical protein DI623_09525 [Sphingomonas sanxanigenens]